VEEYLRRLIEARWRHLQGQGREEAGEDGSEGYFGSDLITIALPFWVAMIAGPLGFQDVVGQMFQQMSSIPEFWQETFQWGILGALGITQLKKAVTR
jgi:hypothetical protein